MRLLDGWCSACWHRAAWSRPTKPPLPSPSIPGPTPCGPSGPILNGRWQFRFDARDQGLRDGWEKPDAPGFDRTIVVPFPWESELSGIHQVKDAPKVGWYRRRFHRPQGVSRRTSRLAPVRRRRLASRRLGERAEGRRARGGLHAFEADISDAVDRDGENVLVVRAFDPDRSQPADRQAGRLVHAQLGHLADRLARGAAQDLHLPTFTSPRHPAGQGARSPSRSPAATRANTSSRCEKIEPDVDHGPVDVRAADDPGGEPVRRAADRRRDHWFRRSAIPSSGPRKTPTSTT